MHNRKQLYISKHSKAASVESINTTPKIFGVEERFCLPVPGVLTYLWHKIKLLSILVKQSPYVNKHIRGSKYEPLVEEA